MIPVTRQIELAHDLDSLAEFGVIAPLGPKVIARAVRVVRRAAGESADEILTYLGLTKETP